ANSDRAGRFDAANGGTLFLDEVGELPLSVQAKLLRTLQNGEIQRLGADKPLHVNVRIIAATNRHLPDSIREGLFRADLYHRLSVYPVPIPPLRERGNDVLILAGQFLELNRTRLGLRGLRLSAAAERALLAYHWPGNVRELEHVISRAALKQLSRGGSRSLIITLEPEVLDLDSAELVAPCAEQPAQIAEQPLPHASLSEAVDACQRQTIVRALELCADNWASAARLLQIDPSNLHKLAKRLRLK
ncbi:MAG: sigma 54-interacting transcriptional regulator, partial [Pseudomonas sp.]